MDTVRRVNVGPIYVAVGCIADILEELADSIFRVEVNRWQNVQVI
jgi:hypothetical protein